MIISKVRAIRVLCLSSNKSYQEENYQLERAAGVIEITGRHEGRAATLIVGFTDLPQQAPTFVVKGDEAVGTMTLHTAQFPAYVTLAHSPGAHFRIGHPAEHNALALEPTYLS